SESKISYATVGAKTKEDAAKILDPLSAKYKNIAGVEEKLTYEARPQPGIKIGYLPQEPQLNPEHTVRESIEEAVSEVVNALKR
ncbi:DUF1307 domain-containing protein, partial [Salmonella enterica subsp. enterica serovar Anatum]|nr:DUF1307 domain-containing protein [Salmonella enterica subsp. enterica serovar Anatum]